ncbi:MFS transporter [Caulobacter sp. 602-1]|uniref:MFS transporter n=1 Tax=Caulobacter sp. 602-1 TaxID=2492472 RepID=UPI00131563D2|nr:MFS transporter [Caulobacter sp. 602-1]
MRGSDAHAAIEPSGRALGPSARALATLTILLLLVVLSYVDRMVIVLMVDPIKADLGLTDVQISVVQGLSFALGFSLAGFPLAWIADRTSRNGVIFAGVILWSASTISAAFVQNYEQLLVARVLVGVGEAALAPAAFSIVADLFRRGGMGLATGVLGAGAPIGAAMAVYAGGQLLAQAHGLPDFTFFGAESQVAWRKVFVMVGAPGLILALLVFLIPSHRREEGPGEGRGGLRAYGRWLGGSWIFVLGLSFAGIQLGIAAYAVASWTPTFLSRQFEVDAGDIGSRLGLLQLAAGVCGYLASGAIIDTLIARGVINAGYRYLTVVAAVLLALGPVIFLVAGKDAAFALIGLFYLVIPYNAAIMATLSQAVPDRFRSRTIALVTSAMTLASMAVGPSSVAMLTDLVFADPKKVGWSLSIVLGVCLPLALLSLGLSWRAGARAIHEQRGSGA